MLSRVAWWTLGLALLAGAAVAGRRGAKPRPLERPSGGGGPRSGLDGLHPEFRGRLELVLADARAAGYDVRVAETLRTADRQAALKAAGSSWTKVSLHESGLAADFWVVSGPGGPIAAYGDPDPDELAALAAVADIAKGYGLEWGGDWKTKRDGYHLELNPAPVTHAQARDRYLAQGPSFDLTA